MKTALAVAGAFLAVACKDTSSHPYVGQRFEGGCLETKTALDVVTGSSAGTNCALKCFRGRPEEAGVRPIYVSTMCPPYPPDLETGDVLPGCPEAIAAAQRDDVCLSDGGSTHPPADAGAD